MGTSGLHCRRPFADQAHTVEISIAADRCHVDNVLDKNEVVAEVTGHVISDMSSVLHLMNMRSLTVRKD